MTSDQGSSRIAELVDDARSTCELHTQCPSDAHRTHLNSLVSDVSWIGPTVVPKIVPLLRDKNLILQLWALDVLGFIGLRHGLESVRDAIPGAVQLLVNSGDEHSLYIAHSIKNIAPSAPELSAALDRLFQSVQGEELVDVAAIIRGLSMQGVMPPSTTLSAAVSFLDLGLARGLPTGWCHCTAVHRCSS